MRWIGGIVANAVFLSRPAVAVWGGVAMGLVAVPYLYEVATTDRPSRARHASAATVSGEVR